ncbi:MAG: ABC transporter ATP-binding protein/permease [Pseudomonadota bacterium]|nr:ABC transporter ATP-binding protein/permease [Pseudomonadota bacterium]
MLSGGLNRIKVLLPDGSTASLSVDLIQAELFGRVVGDLPPAVARTLSAAGLDAAAMHHAASLVSEDTKSAVAYAWTLLVPVHAGLRRHFAEHHLPSWLVLYTGLHGLEMASWIVAWWFLGVWAFGSNVNTGQLLPWAMLLLGIVPLRMLTTATAGHIARTFGGSLKQKLLVGALRIPPGSKRNQGVGRLMGIVLESEALEIRSIRGTLFAAQGLVEILLAAGVLALGAAAALHVSVLFLWLAMSVWLILRYTHARRSWTRSRLALTDDMLEKMVGYRTRLAQQRRADQHEEEDVALAEYVGVSEALDRDAVRMTSILGRGWLVVGTAGLLLPLLGGSASVPLLAASIAGVLMAAVGFGKLSHGCGQVAGGYIAWTELRDLLGASRQRWPTTALSALPALAPRSAKGGALLDLKGLGFSYGAGRAWVLQDCSLTVMAGDRILLEGASGSGKSTFASVLAALQAFDRGVVLANGLDFASLGTRGWRRRIAYVPQFHDNHVFGETLAFNLLLGGEWPPTPDALIEAEQICRELGLGDLIDRMPAGLDEVVGESGWQLSHGERSRVFIARGLLQHADVLILDESTAALDPPTLERVVATVFARSRAVLAIAHP